MLIEQAILKKLLSTSGLTALVGERIYYVKAPQDVTAPYVVFFKVSGPREHSHNGASGLASPRFQFSCFASTYYEAKQIVSAIQAVLQGFQGVMGGGGGVYVGAVFYADESDNYEPDANLYHVSVDYMIWHNE